MGEGVWFLSWTIGMYCWTMDLEAMRMLSQARQPSRILALSWDPAESIL